MPVDLPPNNKPSASAASWGLLLDRSLNWLALVVGIGLCLWAVNSGLHLLS